MAIWSLLLHATCPLSLSLQPSSCFTTTSTRIDFRRVSFSSSIAYPTLSVKSSYYNVQIVVENDEPEEKIVQRFRKEVLRDGILQECRRRRFFETPQDKIKRKAREASKRNRKWRPFPAQNSYDSPNKEKDDDGEEEDNWELFNVDLPYS